MHTNDYIPLSKTALEKLLENGDYILINKYGIYYISYLETGEDDEDFDKIMIYTDDDYFSITTTPNLITCNGNSIHVTDMKNRTYTFELEKRTSITDIFAELN